MKIRMICIFSVAITCFTHSVLSQTAAKKTKSDDIIYLSIYLEHPPTFPGGSTALRRFIGSKMDILKRVSLVGEVIIKMTIDTNGNISSIQPQADTKQPLTKYAVDIVKSMPRWEPGILNGKGVESIVYLPIVFDYRTFAID